MTRNRPADPPPLDPETLAVHGGQFDEPSRCHVPPIHLSTVFRFDSVADMAAVFRGEQPGWIYSRYGSPTVELVEGHLARLEGAPAALATASGMSAIAAALMGFMQAGDHLVAAADLYGGTRHLFDAIFSRLGIATDYFPVDEPARLEALCRPNTRAVYVESPTNPTLRVIDLADAAARARKLGLRTIVDNTFATPLLQRPLELGADLVIHSGTKALGGHDDVLAGFVVGEAGLVGAARDVMKTFGSTLDPHAAWLLERGLKTLGVRVARQCDNAEALAAWLNAHPAIARVHYPGLPGHPGHAVAARQMKRFGGLLAFELRDGAPAVERLFARARLIRLAPTLGGPETIALVPAVSSHIRLTPAERQSIGIADGLVRLSCGLEHIDDLKADLDAGLRGGA